MKRGKFILTALAIFPLTAFAKLTIQNHDKNK